MPPKKRSSSRARSTSRGRAASKGRSSSQSKAKAAVDLSYNAVIKRKFTPERDTWNGEYDFQGPLGALFIMVVSHILLYYFYVCVAHYQGTIIYPGHPMLKGKSMQSAFCEYLSVHAAPTWKAFAIFWSFLLLEYILALALPGFYVKGLSLPSENGYRLTYKCNAIGAWYLILIIVGVLHYTEIFPLYTLRREFGHFLTAAVLSADFISIWVYICGLRHAVRMTGNLIYDFFMGSGLNYRLPGDIDVKMFAECRNSWVLLMLLTLSCAAEQYSELGYLTSNMWFMVFAHLLYVNAVQKGEELITTSWDIYYEKFGWMLAYWNSAGVPFLYCMQSFYIQTVMKEKQHSSWVIAIMVIVLLPTYYVWDSINSQKNRFRMLRSGAPLEVVSRSTFPQLPWRFIENPRTIKGPNGELLVDGFYRYARKLHYTVDVIQALLWGYSCGFDSFIPYFYACFFIGHLIDRERRDDKRCKRKYGKMWDEYIETVPYKFIPYVY